MKLTKTQEQKLIKKIAHITGECDCSADSKSCIYWRRVDGKERDWQAKEIIKEIKKL